MLPSSAGTVPAKSWKAMISTSAMPRSIAMPMPRGSPSFAPATCSRPSNTSSNPPSKPRPPLPELSPPFAPMCASRTRASGTSHPAASPSTTISTTPLSPSHNRNQSLRLPFLLTMCPRHPLPPRLLPLRAAPSDSPAPAPSPPCRVGTPGQSRLLFRKRVFLTRFPPRIALNRLFLIENMKN